MNKTSSDILSKLEELPFPRVYEGIPEIDDGGFGMWLRISELERIKIPFRFVAGIRRNKRVRITIEAIE